MEKYQHNITANSSGALRPLSGASVNVTDKATGLPAALFEDDELTPIPQPLTTDNTGFFSFKAADGKYILAFSGPRFKTFTREIVLEDPDDNPALTAQMLALPNAADKIGYGPGSVREALDRVGKSAVQRLHMKRIAHKLPLLPPDYAAILSATGHGNIYPQAFTIDPVANEIFVVYCGSTQLNLAKWVAVFDRTTSAYKGCFGVGQVVVSEGVAIRYEGAIRYLYAEETDGVLGRYDITTLPPNRSIVPVNATYPVGIAGQVNFRHGVFQIEQNGAPLGGLMSRTSFGWYDSNLNRIGATFFDKVDTGFAGDTPEAAKYWNKFPKRQGSALGDGVILFSYGGFADATAGTSSPYGYQGIKVFNLNGGVIAESMMDPLLMTKIMRDNGLTCTRIENEGVFVDDKGAVFSMYVHRGRFDLPAPTGDGIVIFEEFSAAPDAIDFAPAVKPYSTFRKGDIENGVWPQVADKLVDPMLGTEITTLDQILDLMYAMEIKRASFYASKFPLTDIKGVPFQAGELVQIENANNYTFAVKAVGSTGVRRYLRISGDAGSRVQVNTLPIPTLGGVRFASTESDATNKIDFLLNKHYTNAEKDFQVLNMQSTASNNTVFYGGGSSVYNAATRHIWHTAPNTTTVTGTERMRLDDFDGLTIKPMASADPNNNGEMLFELTSNTSLKVKVKGSDGVIRSATLPLA